MTQISADIKNLDTTWKIKIVLKPVHLMNTFRQLFSYYDARNKPANER